MGGNAEGAGNLYLHIYYFIFLPVIPAGGPSCRGCRHIRRDSGSYAELCDSTARVELLVKKGLLMLTWAHAANKDLKNKRMAEVQAGADRSYEVGSEAGLWIRK